MTRALFGLLACALIVCTPAATLAGKVQTRPYKLALEIAWGDPVGPELWREDLERVVADEVAGRACFTSIERRDPEADATLQPLVLRIVVDDYLERSRYGVGISTLQAPDAAPEARQSEVAEIEAQFRLSLLSQPGDVAVRSRQFGDRVTYRPVMNEDPRYESRNRLLESLRVTIASFVCKGSAEKFERELAAARAR